MVYKVNGYISLLLLFNFLATLGLCILSEDLFIGAVVGSIMFWLIVYMLDQ
jgi:hypothetical protein